MSYENAFYDQRQPRGKHAAPTAPVRIVRPAPRPAPAYQPLPSHLVSAPAPSAQVSAPAIAAIHAAPKPSKPKSTWFGWSRTTVAVVAAVAVVLGVTLTLLLAPRVAPASVAQISSACGAGVQR